MDPVWIRIYCRTLCITLNTGTGSYLIYIRGRCPVLVGVFVTLFYAGVSGAALFKDALAGLGGYGRRQATGRPAHQTQPPEIRYGARYGYGTVPLRYGTGTGTVLLAQTRSIY